MIPNEWTQLSPETKVLSFVRLTKHTGLGYYIAEGLSDAKPLRPCSGDMPHLLSRHEALVFARGLPEIEALEALVRNHEWVTDENGVQFCPFCLRFKEFGHSSACEFVDAITSLKGAGDG